MHIDLHGDMCVHSHMHTVEGSNTMVLNVFVCTVAAAVMSESKAAAIAASAQMTMLHDMRQEHAEQL